MRSRCQHYAEQLPSPREVSALPKECRPQESIHRFLQGTREQRRALPFPVASTTPNSYHPNNRGGDDSLPERKMQIAADNETRRGHYSNLALISHRKEEFIVDFLMIDPQTQSPKGDQAILTSRVIVNPGHMKRLYQAIGENIQRYEKNFGKIVLPPTLT